METTKQFIVDWLYNPQAIADMYNITDLQWKGFKNVLVDIIGESDNATADFIRAISFLAADSEVVSNLFYSFLRRSAATGCAHASNLIYYLKRFNLWDESVLIRAHIIHGWKLPE